MKKFVLSLLIALTFIPLNLKADSYPSLWKQFGNAQNRDLPKSELEILDKIITKAMADKDYGQLLSARIHYISVQGLISNDSVKLLIDRLADEEVKFRDTDPVMSDVYKCVLGKYYRAWLSDEDSADVKSKTYYREAMLHPERLAACKTGDYSPLFKDGLDDHIFNRDLLHVIGFEVEDYRTMYDYYTRVGNRAAACICAAKDFDKNQKIDGYQAKKSKYLSTLDSLMKVYGDLPEAGEFAILRYSYMQDCEDVSVDEQVKFLKYALDKWGKWPHLNVFKSYLRDLTYPMFNVEIPQQAIVGKKQVAKVREIRNLSSLTVKIYKVDLTADHNLRIYNAKDYQLIKRKIAKSPVWEQTRKYNCEPDYRIQEDSFEIAGLPQGTYWIEVASDKNIGVSESFYYVSDVAVEYVKLPGQKMRLAVVSARTGHPLAHAKVRLYWNKKSEELSCDENGEVVYFYDGQRPNSIYAFTPDDGYAPKSNVSGNYYFDGSKRVDEREQIFTDRSLYRPGQMVKVSVLTYQVMEHKDSKVLPSKKVEIKLSNANGKVVETKNVVTDEFGVAAVDFVLPKTGLTGMYYVRSSKGQTGIKVEEYKRPTFDVKLPKVEKKYQFGDTVQVKGLAKGFNGIPVQNASVQYTVTRRPMYRWWGNGSTEIVQKEKLNTDENGNFIVKLPLTLAVEDQTKSRIFYSYQVEALVTSLNGETHSASMSLPVSNHPTILSCNLPTLFEKDSLKSVVFKYRNISAVDIPAQVRYRIDQGKEFVVNSNEQCNMSESISHLTTGEHTLYAFCGTDSLKQNFTIFSLHDHRPVIKTPIWSYQNSTKFRNDGKSVVTQIGSSEKNLHVLYNVFSGHKVIEQGTTEISDSIITREWKYKKEYGEGITIIYCWLKDGKKYSESFHISLPVPDKELNVRWETFRNHLVPGQKETWTLKISNSDGTPAKAQMMAVLYDKSLDDIYKHEWNFSYNLYHNTPIVSWRSNLDYLSNNSFVRSMSYKDDFPYRNLDIARFYLDPYSSSSEIIAYGFGKHKMRKNVGTRATNVMLLTKQSSMKDSRSYSSKESRVFDVVEQMPVFPRQSQDIKKETVQMRANLNETAFMQPQLVADKNGVVAVRFTLPESTTTWKFMGLAHDKEMKYGSIEDEVVANKKVMIQPNMPRFIRVGDQVKITAMVTNSSCKKMKATAKLLLLDAETGKQVYSQTQKVLMAGNVDSEILPVTFDYQATEKTPAILVARVSVEGGDFSDGEQHYLPVLRNTELVTRTKTFTQVTAGHKVIDMASMVPSTAQGKVSYTIEYTNQPAWMMIQALPSISNPCEKDAISMASAIYANTIGRFILNSNEHIKKVVEQWKTEKDDRNSLTSNLLKNDELKVLSLDETLWLSAANREVENKRKLIEFLDNTGMDARLKEQTKQLSILQNGNGSWSWWPGMPGSLYMTVAVSETLVRLNHLIGMQTSTRNMLTLAFKYMSAEIHKEVVEMKKQEKKGNKNIMPSDVALHYLYLLSVDGRTLDIQTQEDKVYLLEHLADEHAMLSIYGKANAAVILSLNGNKKAAEQLQSLKEYTVYREEMGRYFDSPKAEYSWFDYKIPSQIAAIEALQLLTPSDKKTIEEMQRWLLQSKRTQAWDTPINTVDAVYAFLKGNERFLEGRKTENTVLKVDGKVLDASDRLGYVKTVVDGKHQTLNAEKTGEGISWGNIYAQFQQKSSDVENASTGIKIERKVIAKDGFAIGNRVKVQLTILADRDYDFVEVVDKRPACFEPVNQLSGYRWGYYVSPRDETTNYYIDRLSKGIHKIETEYYIDRAGKYQSGSCVVQSAYSPEFRGIAKGEVITVK